MPTYWQEYVAPHNLNFNYPVLVHTILQETLLKDADALSTDEEEERWIHQDTVQNAVGINEMN